MPDARSFDEPYILGKRERVHYLVREALYTLREDTIPGPDGTGKKLLSGGANNFAEVLARLFARYVLRSVLYIPSYNAYFLADLARVLSLDEIEVRTETAGVQTGAKRLRRVESYIYEQLSEDFRRWPELVWAAQDRLSEWLRLEEDRERRELRRMEETRAEGEAADTGDAVGKPKAPPRPDANEKRLAKEYRAKNTDIGRKAFAKLKGISEQHLKHVLQKVRAYDRFRQSK